MLTRIDVNMDEIDQSDLEAYVRANFMPADVFEEVELDEWARGNGWVEKTELDAAEEEIVELEAKIKKLEQE